MAVVTIIVVNTNSGSLLAKCINALLAQTLTEFEIIIADNCSRDNSLDGLPRDARLRVVRNMENVGFAAANNQIGLVVTTPFIACVNPDVIPQADWLERLVNAAVISPEFVMFGSSQLDAVDPEYVDGFGDEYFCGGFAWRRENGAKMPERLPSGEMFSPCAAAALYRTVWFQAIGGFAEGFFCYMEDIDLAFRMRLRGGRCLQVGAAVVYHHGYAESGYQTDFMLYHVMRNLIWTYQRNMPAPLVLMTIVPHCCCIVAMWLWALFRGYHKPVTRGILHAFLSVPQVLTQRAQIQSSRTASSKSIGQALIWNPYKVLSWWRRVKERDLRNCGRRKCER